jgi:hypothetical protein
MQDALFGLSSRMQSWKARWMLVWRLLADAMQ